jgi:hypothetical protein
VGLSRDAGEGASTEERGKKTSKPAKKRRRPAKNSPMEPKEPTVIEKQTKQDMKTSLEGIDKECTWGCKKTVRGMCPFGKGTSGPKVRCTLMSVTPGFL